MSVVEIVVVLAPAPALAAATTAWLFVARQRHVSVEAATLKERQYVRDFLADIDRWEATR